MDNGVDWPTVITLASSLLTLVLVIVGTVWGTGLWTNREKIEIKTSGVICGIATYEKSRFTVTDLEIQRKGEKDIRYLNKILLKLDKHIYYELEKFLDFDGRWKTDKDAYNELDERSMILFDARIAIYKYKPVKITWPGYEHKIINPSDWDREKEGMQEKLQRATFQVGLVWEDKPNKTKWKTVTQQDYGNWTKV